MELSLVHKEAQIHKKLISSHIGYALWWLLKSRNHFIHSLLKSRDITLQTKVHLVKAMVYSLVIYTCESNHKEG